MVRLAPTAEILFDSDRLMVMEPNGGLYGAYRGLVPNLAYAVEHLEVDDLPILVEPEAVFGDGHCVGVRVAGERELAWRDGFHLMWFKGHAWWVEDTLHLAEATDAVSGHRFSR